VKEAAQEMFAQGEQDSDSSDDDDDETDQGIEVGSDRYCPPHHPTHYESSLLEFSGIL
jgi:hypothetical protein